MKRYCILTGGGLGDVIYSIYKRNNFSYIKSFILNQTPKPYVKLFIVCHNPEAINLFINQDWIDEIKQVAYTDTLQPYQSELNGYELIYPFTKEKTEITNYISFNYNQKSLDKLNLLIENEYIIIQPYAGQNDRDLTQKYIQQIGNDNIETVLYVVGKNYERVSHTKEINPFIGKNIVNLIDELTISELIYLIAHKNCLNIYTAHTVTAIIAWLFKKKNTCYVPANGRGYNQMQDNNINPWNFGKWNNNTEIIYMQEDKNE